MFVRSLFYRARFIFASKRVDTNGHVCITIGCGIEHGRERWGTKKKREEEEKRGEEKRREEGRKEVKNIESESARALPNDRVICSLLSALSLCVCCTVDN